MTTLSDRHQPPTRRPRLVVLALLAACVTPGLTLTRSAAATPPELPLQLIAEPQAGVTPFLELIDSAHSSIELTMYELTDPRIERALEMAAHRGVAVRVLLNGGDDGEHENAPADAALAAHGVQVRFTPTYFALTHQKTLTVDGHRSAIMTLNFDGRYASTRDYAVLDGQTADVRAIVSTFDADWNGRRITPSDGSGDLVWSPGAQTAVMRLIDSAHRSITLESEEMDDRRDTDALCAAARRGVDVRIVMTEERVWRAAFAQLAGCGAHIRLYHGQGYFIHAKLLEIDGAEALVGSQNLSPTSLDDNRELGIELTDPPLIRQLTADFDSDYDGAGAQVS